MDKKIKITDLDLEEADNKSSSIAEEKIVFCDLSHEEKGELQKSIPFYLYFVFLIPILGVVAVLLGCLQKKYRFLHQMPAGIVSILSTILPIMLLSFGSLWAKSNWKNELAQKAESGVVIIETEVKRLWGLINDSGFGTGVVVAKEDAMTLILTNRHVVCDENGNVSSSLKILTALGEEYSTTVVALPKDRDIDMALLCIDKQNSLRVLGNIGDYSSLKTGDEVVAIGHPEGLSFTMTDGIISGLRNRMLIQSSASINPGNSGGPLLDSRGRIIGINTFFLKDTQGLNFAYRADFITKQHAWNYKREISHLLNRITIE